MALDPNVLKALRIRIGLDPNDSAKDALIEACYASAMAVCEVYCDRLFEFKAGEVEWLGPVRYSLQLKRYPVKELTSVILNGKLLEPGTYTLNAEAGIVLRVGGGFAVMGNSGTLPYAVTYDGGYEVLPPDLSVAIGFAFDALWSATPGWGLDTSGGGGVMAKVSVVGVGSIDFDTGSGSAGQRFASDVAPWGLLPVTVTAILQRYMRHTVIAGG